MPHLCCLPVTLTRLLAPHEIPLTSCMPRLPGLCRQGVPLMPRARAVWWQDPECLICKYYLHLSAVVCTCRPAKLACLKVSARPGSHGSGPLAGHASPPRLLSCTMCISLVIGSPSTDTMAAGAASPDLGSSACVQHARELCECQQASERSLLYRYSLADLEDLLARVAPPPASPDLERPETPPPNDLLAHAADDSPASTALRRRAIMRQTRSPGPAAEGAIVKQETCTKRVSTRRGALDTRQPVRLEGPRRSIWIAVAPSYRLVRLSTYRVVACILQVHGRSASHAALAFSWAAQAHSTLQQRPSLEQVAALLQEADEFLWGGHEVDLVSTAQLPPQPSIMHVVHERFGNLRFHPPRSFFVVCKDTSAFLGRTVFARRVGEQGRLSVQVREVVTRCVEVQEWAAELAAVAGSAARRVALSRLQEAARRSATAPPVAGHAHLVRALEERLRRATAMAAKMDTAMQPGAAVPLEARQAQVRTHSRCVLSGSWHAPPGYAGPLPCSTFSGRFRSQGVCVYAALGELTWLLLSAGRRCCARRSPSRWFSPRGLLSGACCRRRTRGWTRCAACWGAGLCRGGAPQESSPTATTWAACSSRGCASGCGPRRWPLWRRWWAACASGRPQRASCRRTRDPSR